MTTKVISLKDYRKNITKLWKEAQKDKVKLIVMYHSKPILEVKPYEGDELVFEDYSADHQQDYYKTIEQNFDFWHKKEDDSIFEI